MRKALFVVFALSLLGIAGVRAEEEQAERRTITVVGRGEVAVSPDLGVLSVAVETTARTAGEATAANAEKSASVLDAIKRLMEDRDSLKTTQYNLQPQYSGRKPGSPAPPEITGYIARNQVRAEIHDLDAVGKIIDAALQAGANRASNLSFVVENRNPHIRAALTKAGLEARAQAESIAGALGVKLGDVISASTTSAPPPVRVDQPMVMRLETATTPIEPGDVKISATLYVTYEIQ